MQDQGVNVQKKNIGIIFGGKSTEHEVSLQSARNIVDAIDREKFDITLIGIDKNGIWHLNESTHFLLNSDNPSLIALHQSGRNLAFIPDQSEKQVIEFKEQALFQLDVIFPIVYGTLGEDGSIPDQYGEILVNEINTLPGFTNISMYLKLWEASG